VTAVAFFAMPEAGHFGRLRPLIADISRSGLTPYVFTHRDFRAGVERAGGAFVDLFARYPLEDADDESIPVPCRFVSFAGHYAEQILADVEEIRPALVVYDTFSVIGHVVGRMLGVPYLNVCAGHNLNPSEAVLRLRNDRRVQLSPRCGEAVELLRERYGLADASPFSFVTGLSPFLNVYCEPPAYLTEAERRPFEPLAFYGSLPPIEEIDGREPRRGSDETLRIYVSFGTVVWRYWTDEALAALACISDVVGELENARTLISLGGTQADARSLIRPNVSVETYVDQWEALRDADVFITHQGMNSTHEAIFNRVPMISYPFFADQPGLAAKCRDFGLAVPLAEAPRATLRPEDVRRALDEVMANREPMLASLERARGWELEVMSDRDSVVRRILGLL
jgi:MGT family glycosyltransferase